MLDQTAVVLMEVMKLAATARGRRERRDAPDQSVCQPAVSTVAAADNRRAVRCEVVG